MRRIVVDLLVLFGIAFCGLASAQVAVDAYPLGNSTQIDRRYWSARQAGSNQDAYRGVRDQGLIIYSRGHADSEYGLQLSQPSGGVLEAVLNVNNARARACPGHHSSATAYMTLVAFNESAAQAHGDATGDVRAIVALGRDDNDAANALGLNYAVIKCTDAMCVLGDAEVLASGSLLQPAYIGTPLAIQISWDDATKRFAFRVDADATVYSPAHSGPQGGEPGLPGGSFSIVHAVAEACGTEAYSTMELSVRDVRIGRRH